MSTGGVSVQGGLCSGGSLSRGSLPGESLSRGSLPGESLSGRHPMCGKERAVRILLECILVT